MKRWLIHTFIAGYLSMLFLGVASYALSLNLTGHPASYFFVWDMFCGWSAYSSRLQIVGQGESGKFYRLAPGPWGEFQPYGELGRRHYDSFGFHADRMAMNAVKQTSHEPLTNIFVIEEVWAKKFNLPESVWSRRYDEPKDVYRYYSVKSLLDGDGNLLQAGSSWYAKQASLAVSDNPRLKGDSKRGQPFYAVNVADRSEASSLSAGGYNPSAQQQPASLLGGN